MDIKITVETQQQTFYFEVADFMHHENGHCKFEAFNNGQLVVGFEPDSYNCLQICKNPGLLNEDVLYLLADKIEQLKL